MPATRRAEGRISGLISKTNTVVDMPVHPKLKIVLDKATRYGDRIVASKRSPNSFTASDFQASWQKAKAKLLKNGHLTSSVTFHGLRHTIAAALAEAGCGPLELMSITGHNNAAFVEAYIREASKKRMADSGSASSGRGSNST